MVAPTDDAYFVYLLYRDIKRHPETAKGGLGVLSFQSCRQSQVSPVFTDTGNMVQTYFYPHEKRDEIITLMDADFLVRDGRAYIRGTNVSQVEATNRAVNYNPAAVGGIQLSYTAEHFRRSDTGQVVESATVIELLPNRSVWAWGLKNRAKER